MRFRVSSWAVTAAAVLFIHGCADSPSESADDGRLSRIYVANTESQSVSVIAHETMEVIDTINIGNAPHGHGPSSDGDRIYVTTDDGHGEIIAIDTADNSILWRLDAGNDLNEPHLTRDNRYLYAPDLLGQVTYVVDVVEQKIATEIPTPGAALHNTYASHDGERMYVTAILTQQIFEIDVATREITREYKLSGDPRPAQITEDDKTMYVQLSDFHGFIELDLENGEETRSIEWPEPAEEDLPPSWGTEGPISTKCHGLKITPDGKEIWANTNMENKTYVYSLPGLEQLAVIDVGESPNWIAFSGDGSTAYVTNADCASPNGTVSAIDVTSRQVIKTIDVGKCPKRIHLVKLPAKSK
jgi:YVTN family beta-propeller protein